MRRSQYLRPCQQLSIENDAALHVVGPHLRILSNAVVKAPAGDPSDFCITRSAEPALFMPEKTKRTSTPKCFLHMGSFAVFEVGFIGR
jgi:hypothetical protein